MVRPLVPPSYIRDALIDPDASLQSNVESAALRLHALRDELEYPGMRVLQFAFGGDENQHLPHHYQRDCVAYTGTHDNDTTAGWWAGLSADERSRVRHYLGGIDDGICWSMARTVLASVACLAILPLQDVLGLGSEARMNVPGRSSDNWSWRFDPALVTDDVASQPRERATDRRVAGNHASSRPRLSPCMAERQKTPRRRASRTLTPASWQFECGTAAPWPSSG